jgi:hypothetical protein
VHPSFHLAPQFLQLTDHAPALGFAVHHESSAGDGKTYRSLSRVARAITGGHWNGPRFFGLTGSKAMARATATIASTEKAGMSGADKDRGVVP